MSTFAIPFEETGRRMTKNQKKLKKVLEVSNKCLPLQSQTKNGHTDARVWHEKFIEKTEEKYKKQVPRKIQFIEKR